MSLERFILSAASIPHEMQRYNTVGDWNYAEGGELIVSVSDCSAFDPCTNTAQNTENLIVVHEIIEAMICQDRGISEASVTQWDLDHIDHPDPGSIPGCPYYREHMFAELIERAVAAELDVNWDTHEMIIENLCSTGDSDGV